MTQFHYKSVTAAGEVQEGRIEAGDRAAVIRRIQEAGQIPISAEPMGAGARGLRRFSPWFRRRRPLPARAIAFFTQALASLLRAGVPLDHALHIMLESESDPALHRLVAEVQRAVRGGASFHAALEAQNAFSPFYLSMARTAEASGSLDTGLLKLVDYLERRSEQRDQLTAALIYPALLVTITGCSLLLILTYVVPKFEPLFADLGAGVPAATRIVLGLAHWLTSYGWLVPPVLLAAALYLRHSLGDPTARQRIDRWLLRAPLVGSLISRLETARFCRSLGTLLSSGVPVIKSLAIARESVSNRVIAQALDDATARLKDGGRLVEPLAATAAFPRLALQMMKVGEETGDLDGMLLRIAEIYDREVSVAIRRILALLEPVLIVGLGVVIAAIIMSVLVGVVSLNDLPV